MCEMPAPRQKSSFRVLLAAWRLGPRAVDPAPSRRSSLSAVSEPAYSDVGADREYHGCSRMAPNGKETHEADIGAQARRLHGREPVDQLGRRPDDRSGPSMLRIAPGP